MCSQWTHRLPGVVAAMVAALVLAPVAPALAMAKGSGVIEVAVVNYCNTSSLADVAVELVNIETAEVVASTVTELEGNAAFADLPYGLYQLRATAEGYRDAASPLVPVVESAQPRRIIPVRIEMQDQEQQCSCDPDAPDYDEDCECAEGSTTGVVVAAAAGFAFLGLGGGAAIAALVGIAAVAAAVTVAVVAAAPPPVSP